MNTLNSSEVEGPVTRIPCHVHLNSSPVISISAEAFSRVLPFAAAASFIASFSIALPAPLIVSCQASPAASFSLVKLCQLMEPAQTHHSFLTRQMHRTNSLKWLTLLCVEDKLKDLTTEVEFLRCVSDVCMKKCFLSNTTTKFLVTD